MNNSKNYCVISINTINEDPYYQIKLNKKFVNKININFYISRYHSISDLLFLGYKLSETFKCKKYYNLIFNFKNCPKKVKNLQEFKNVMRGIFHIKLHNNILNINNNINILSNSVLEHSLMYGKYPNFNDFKNIISFNKIKNYINNLLNKKYEDEIILQIILQIKDLLK